MIFLTPKCFKVRLLLDTAPKGAVKTMQSHTALPCSPRVVTVGKKFFSLILIVCVTLLPASGFAARQEDLESEQMFVVPPDLAPGNLNQLDKIRRKAALDALLAKALANAGEEGEAEAESESEFEPELPGRCRFHSDCGAGQICLSGSCVDRGTKCTLDSHCYASEKCRNGQCVPRDSCLIDSDCSGNELCRSGKCLPPGSCETTADCSGVQVCQGGQCILPPGACETNSDCPSGKICESNQCVTPPSCQSDMDCPGGKICQDGKCVLGPCQTNSDCPSGKICKDAQCVPPPEQCQNDNDCSDGKKCRNGECVPPCGKDSDCPEGKTCQDGACLPPPGTTTGTTTGDQQGTTTGDQQGTATGDQGTTTGDQQGTTTGDQQGTTTGDQQGTTTGDQQGTTTGDQQGTTTGGQGTTTGTTTDTGTTGGVGVGVGVGGQGDQGGQGGQGGQGSQGGQGGGKGETGSEEQCPAGSNCMGPGTCLLRGGMTGAPCPGGVCCSGLGSGSGGTGQLPPLPGCIGPIYCRDNYDKDGDLSYGCLNCIDRDPTETGVDCWVMCTSINQSEWCLYRYPDGRVEEKKLSPRPMSFCQGRKIPPDEVWNRCGGCVNLCTDIQDPSISGDEKSFVTNCPHPLKLHVGDNNEPAAASCDCNGDGTVDVDCKLKDYRPPGGAGPCREGKKDCPAPEVCVGGACRMPTCHVSPGAWKPETELRYYHCDCTAPPPPPPPPVCGNGKIEGEEECDDGNNVDGDGCSKDCKHEICGDGVANVGEECGEGQAQPPDKDCKNCKLVPKPPKCGNGIAEAEEECGEPGLPPLPPGFLCVNCKRVAQPRCGDGIINQKNEQCDGNQGQCAAGQACRRCRCADVCGDGIRRGGEQCDRQDFGSQPANGQICVNCRRRNNCGNGVIDGTEKCEVGQLQNCLGGQTCNRCQCADVCGDGKIQGKEQCDDGNRKNGDGCNAQCRIENCGNGKVDPGETCDDGNTKSGDGCSATCKIEPTCGNGRLDPGEGCDPKESKSSCPAAHRCNATCGCEPLPPVCGDGVAQVGEQCDPPGVWQCVAGEEVCKECDCGPDEPECGNGTVDPGEGCGEPGKICAKGQRCTFCDCQAFECGNGIIDPGEQCDDGDTDDGDGCSSKCLIEAPVKGSDCCGGAFVATGRSKDGKTLCCPRYPNSRAPCFPKDCPYEIKAQCGNKVIDAGEGCDDGNKIDCDGCNNDCTKTHFVDCTHKDCTSVSQGKTLPHTVRESCASYAYIGGGDCRCVSCIQTACFTVGSTATFVNNT